MHVQGSSPGSVSFGAPFIPVKSAAAAVAPKESLNTTFSPIEEIASIESSTTRIDSQVVYSFSHLESVSARISAPSLEAIPSEPVPTGTPDTPVVQNGGSAAEAGANVSPGRSEAPATGAGQTSNQNAVSSLEPGSDAGVSPAENDNLAPEQTTPQQPQQRAQNDEGRQAQGGADGSKASEIGLSEQDRSVIKALASRDREVRTHEQQHQSVGGQYAGAATFSLKRGPDGVQYAVGGEVSIDIAEVPNNPAATIEKMRTVRAAALAPAEPSSQDRAVAAAATRIMLKAQAEAAKQERESLSESQESSGTKLKDLREQEQKDKEARAEARSKGAEGVATYEQLIQLGRQFEQGLIPEINLDQLA